ncbi:MAG: hypothetical protein KC609_02190, partial [Myxococcales bacterium]|nr:hypothetical protein [Myxococcales bacterium]
MTEPQPYETFVSALVDHALSRPLRDWLHSESLIALVEAVLATPEWVAIAEAQTRPLLERQQLRVAAVDSQLPATDRERLEAYLDEQSRAAIVSIIRDLPPIPPEALRELLKRDDVRPHLQRFFEDALER